MRWPWSRREAEPDPPVAAQHGADVPAPPVMGWAFLPPIQRSLAAPMPSITRLEVFPTELPAWRSPAFTGPATHAVVDTAPAGVIDADGGGLGRPTATPVPAPELTLLPPPRPTPVQRAKSPAPVRPEVPPETPSLTRVHNAHLPVVQRVAVTDEPGEPVPEDAAPDDPVPDDPVPDDPVPDDPVPDDAVPDAVPGDQPAGVSAGPSAVSAAADVEVPVDGPAGSPTVATVERPTVLGLGPPLAAIPDTATVAPPLSAVASPSSLPLVGARGFTEVPVQRSAVPTVRPGPEPTVQRSVRPTAQGRAETPTATTAGNAQDAVVAPERSVVDPTPPEDAEAEPTPEPAPEPEPTDPGDDHETAQETRPEPPPMGSAPLPLATAMPTTIQRSTESSMPGAPVPRLLVRRAPDHAPPGSERVVPVRRVLADPAATLRPGAITPSSSPAVQRGFLATVLQRRTASPAAAPSPSPEPKRVQRGFLAAAFRRPPASTAARTPEPEVTAVRPGVRSVTPAAPPSHRAAVQQAPVGRPGTLLQEHGVDVPLGAAAATAPPPAPPTAPLTAPPAAPPAVTAARTSTVVQRETRDVVPMPLPRVQAPTTVPVQAMPTDDGPPTVPATAPPAPGQPGTAPVVARAGEPAATPSTPASPAGAAAAAGEATDVEALAQRLFPPMLRRMKAELLLDRERRGMRTDAW